LVGKSAGLGGDQMPGTVLWFAVILAALPTMWYAGLFAARIQDRWRRNCVITGAAMLLVGWSILIRHPAVAVQVIPISALARLEGIGAAPLFMFVIGVGWRLAIYRRQRALIVVGMGLGIGYFIQGGLWMMRPTPANAFSTTTHLLCVMQSQDYSCVPAASATSLRMLGIHATEEELAQLTETREGSGATLLRALNGIDVRLKHTGIEADLLELSYDQLLRVEPPMLTPLRYDAAQLHMVTIIEVRPHLVVVADPQTGVEFLSRHQFLQAYNGQVIAFQGQVDRATTADVIAQYPFLYDPDQPIQATLTSVQTEP